MNPFAPKLPRPTFAGVVAVLALVVAASGTAYSAVQLNGRNIQPHSIPGNRLQANAVVPRAKTAATTSQLVVPTAKKHKGQRGDSTRDSGPGLIELSAGQSATVLASDPFKITATCVDPAHLNIYATSTEGNWYTSSPSGYGGGGPIAAGAQVTLLQTSLGGNPVVNTTQSFVVFTFDGHVLHVAPIDYGLNIPGVGCLVSGYAIAPNP